MRSNLHQIFRRVGIGRPKKRHQRLIDSPRILVQHIRQARPRVLQRLAEAHQLRRNPGRLRPA